MPDTIYTIGYANKSLEQFISQLQRYQINAVVDVRSVPYSNYFFDYHRENIELVLKQNAIRYIYMGDLLGPRSKNEAHYENGQVQFDRLMQATEFQQGAQRLQAGVAKGFNIVLMCAEKDPAVCHRSLLIAYYIERLFNDELELQHICHDGELESQHQLETRLMHDQNIEPGLFSNEQEDLQRAYQYQVLRYAYKKDS